MAKNEKQNENKEQDLLALALSQTTKNVSKSRGGSGRKTYLDRFVGTLLDEDGKPVEPKSRTQVIAEMSLEIALEQRESDMDAGKDVQPFDLTNEEDQKIFKKINNKVKSQVASAVADNSNNTSVSYHPDYKDVWYVKKTGDKVSLAPASERPEEDRPKHD